MIILKMSIFANLLSEYALTTYLALQPAMLITAACSYTLPHLSERLISDYAHYKKMNHNISPLIPSPKQGLSPKTAVLQTHLAFNLSLIVYQSSHFINRLKQLSCL